MVQALEHQMHGLSLIHGGLKYALGTRPSYIIRSNTILTSIKRRPTFFNRDLIPKMKRYKSALPNPPLAYFIKKNQLEISGFDKKSHFQNTKKLSGFFNLLASEFLGNVVQG